MIQDNDPHEVKSEAPFKPKGRRDDGHLRISAVAGVGVLLPDKEDLASYSLMFDATVMNPLVMCRRDAARLRPRHAILQAVEGKEDKCRDIYKVTFKLFPLAFYTCDNGGTPATSLSVNSEASRTRNTRITTRWENG